MKIRLTLKVLTASLLLASCAQTPTEQGALNIQPFEEVRHSYDQARAQYALGRYYHGELRYEQAIEAYRQALVLSPGMVDALNALGVAYAESGHFDLARQQFEAALKRAPYSAYTYNNLGFVNYLAGDYLAAVRAYRASLRLDGSQEKARRNLALASSRIGEAQSAHAETPATPVAAQPPAQAIAQTGGQQGAWVKVSPQVYELRPAVAATPATRVADAAAERPARSVAPKRTAANASVPAIDSAGAHSSEEGSSLRLTAFEASAVADTPHQQAPIAPLRGVEVSNGNGIRGLAARVAGYFHGQGVPHARLTNQKPFTEPHTRIEYRPGSAAEAARINGLLPRAVPVTASRHLRPDIRVRLVLGRDLQRNILAGLPSPNGTKLAEANAAPDDL